MAFPPRSQDELLTEQFYAWERRGRGWRVFPHPVQPEPPFRPFVGHFVADPPAITEPLRRPSLFGAVLENLRGDTSPSPITKDPLPAWVTEEPPLEPFAFGSPLVEIQITMPTDLKVSRERSTLALSWLANSYYPLAFEVIGLPNAVSVQFVCTELDRAQFAEQILAYFPEATLSLRPGFLAALWESIQGPTAMVDFGLSQEFMIPVRAARDFDIDPFIPLVAALAELKPNELGVFQVIAEPLRCPWAESIMRAVTDGEGRSFFPDAPDLVARAREKTAQPLAAAVVRVAGRAKTEARAWEIARNVGSAFIQFAEPTGNEFIPLDNEGYPDELHASDFPQRTSRRSGMILNSTELVSLMHLPSASVRTEKFRQLPKPTFAGIPDYLRTRHVYVAGATQHGKSTFIERMALADIDHGHGLCILDPKGDLVKSIVHKIPQHRADDTILLETANPVPIDFMSWETEQERQTLAADIFQTFLQFSTMTAGDQWLSILRAVIYTLLDAGGCSFLDINAILVNDQKRAEILARVRDSGVLDYWKLEYPFLKKDAAQPIITRMKQFTFTPALRTLLGSPKATLDIFDCMERRKILLVDLTGAGKANGNLVGQLLVSKIQQSAFRRDRQPREERIPFHLYADEFQNFQTSAFDVILSEAGGYKLCLTLANQGLYQLDSKIKDAIFSNVTGAWVVFHIDEKDVSDFKLRALPLDSKQLAALPPHSAFIKIGTEPPTIVHTLPPVPNPPESSADYIRKRTHELYAIPQPARDSPGRRGAAIEPGVPGARPKPSQTPDSGHPNPAQNKGDSEFYE